MSDPYHIELKIDGRELDALALMRLSRAVVDDNIQFPAMFELAFMEEFPDATGFEGLGISIGSSVTVSAANRGTSEDILTGEVTALEGEYDALGRLLIVRGYDKLHRLHHGRKTKAWLEKTHSDIVQEVVQAGGLTTGTIDSTTVTHAYVVQPGLTDWEFLRSVARVTGYDLTMNDGSVDFRQPSDPSNESEASSYDSVAGTQLVQGDNLLAFRPRVTAAEQVTGVEVRGWDPEQKQAVSATASAGTKSASIADTPDALAGDVNGGTYTTLRGLTAADEAQAVADAIAERIGSAFVEAEGIAEGNPALHAGVTVSISDTCSTFDGDYVLSGTRHVFEAGSYVTEFTISGRQERSLLGLTSAGATNEDVQPMHGLVVGIVTDINDDKNQGRVKVKLPALSDEYSTDWARVSYLGAGSDRGFLAVPEIDDEVIVGFSHGDPRRPVVLGTLYNGVNLPKDASSAVTGGVVKKRVFTSGKGHVLEFRDSDESGILIKTSSGEKIDLDDGNTKITIHSGGDITIEGTGNVKVDATGSLTLTGGTELKMSAPTVKITADGTAELSSGGQLTLKGTSTELKAEGMLNLQSSGIASLQGAVVQIN